MRVLGLVALALTVCACISIQAPPTARPVTPEPTPAPAQTASPTPQPTPVATPTDEPATLDPNATPAPTPIDLLPYLSSEVTVVNLAAHPLTVTVTLLDPESTDEYEVGAFELQPEQVTAQAIVPARHRLVFTIDGEAVGTCTTEVASEEQLQFAVIEAGVVVTSSAGEPADAAEMVIATASRCQAGAAT